MRTSVRHFLEAALGTLRLRGPVALLSDRDSTEFVAIEPALPGVVVHCRLPAVPAGHERRYIALPLAAESMGTVACFDLVRRVEEAAMLLDATLPLLAPGGVLLWTVDVGTARPEAGLSRVLTPLGLERLVAHHDAALVGWQGADDFPTSLYLVAYRSPTGHEFAHQAGRFLEAMHDPQFASREAEPWRSFARALWRRVRLRRKTASREAREAATFAVHLPRTSDWRSALVDSQPADDDRGSRIDLC